MSCYAHDVVTMNISLDEELAKRLEELAKRTRRSVDVILADAARAHVEYTERFLADVEAGLRDADSGRVMSGEQVLAELARRRAERKR